MAARRPKNEANLRRHRVLDRLGESEQRPRSALARQRVGQIVAIEMYLEGLSADFHAF